MNLSQIQLYRNKNLPKGKTVFIFSPHPDDTSISVGGVAALLSAKNKVVSMVMTSGHRAKIPGLKKSARMELRKKEASSEAKILGIGVEFLNLPLYDSGKIRQKDMEILSGLFQKYSPDLVFMPQMEDVHPTHRLCSQLVYQTILQYTQQALTTLDLWYYESPWSLFNRDDYNVVVSLPSAIFEKKLKAIRAHRSQNARTRYDIFASSLAQMRAAVVAEQSLAGYGKRSIKMDAHAELFSVVTVGKKAKLVESFSGIRGIWRQGLTTEVARHYGYVYGSWLKRTLDVNPKVIVAMDTRSSGPQIKQALMEGLRKSHCHIFDIHVATTPMAQFEVRNRRCEGGVMITASHNEPQWNGFKFFWKDGGVLSPAQMQEVIGSYHAQAQDEERPYVEHYIRYLMEAIGEEGLKKIRSAKLKVVVDPNGGAVIVVLKKLFNILNVEAVELNMSQGNFAHLIEPTSIALKAMAPVILQNGADFGVAWDCDGDRLEIMLPGGELLSGHTILALLFDQILSKPAAGKSGGKKVVINAATSGMVAEVAKKYLAEVIETDVGEANVIAMMEKTGALVGGEGGSGGGIVPPSRCRDGLLTLLKIMELMVEKNKSLPEILKEYPKYFTRHSNIHMDTSAMPQLHRDIRKCFQDAAFRTFDGERGGMKLTWKDGTFLWFRESKTEKDIVRCLVDSKNEKRAEEVFKRANRCLERARSLH